jgi:hypothetical protein
MEFGRLNCDGRTIARGPSRSTFKRGSRQDNNRCARARFIGPTRTDAGHADVNDVTPDSDI